jgi:hypothetical protein
MADDINLDLLSLDGTSSLKETPPTPPEEEIDETQEEQQEEQAEEQEESQEEESSEEQSEESSETHEAPKEVVVDYVALFGEGYDTPEKVKQEISKVQTLAKELEEAKSATITYSDPMVERLDGILKTTPGINKQIAVTLSSLEEADIKGMDDSALIKLKMQLDNPLLVGNDRLIARKLEKDYRFMPSQEALDDMSDEEREETEDEVKLSQLQLKADAQKVRDELSGILSKATATTTKPTPVDLQAQKAALVEAWVEPSKKIISKEISIPDGEWDKELLKFAVDDAEFAQITANIPQYAANNGLQLNEDNFKAISGQVLSNYIMGKLPKIIKAVKDKVKAETTLEVEKKYTNPSSKRTESKGTRKSGDTDLSPLI